MQHRIFLSSTFKDLQDEREAVENVIHQMGDQYDGMEYFGSSPNEPLIECLARVQLADILILVVANYHGHVPKGRKRSMVEREYYEAIEHSVPVLPYLSDPSAYPPSGRNQRKIQAFRDLLREKHLTPSFKSAENLAMQVATDLARFIRDRLTSIDADAGPTRVRGHRLVVELMQRGAYRKALKVNQELLDRFRHSPRAHYNHACICTRLAETCSDGDRWTYLRRARSRMSDALTYGFLKFILLYSDRSDPRRADPVQFVLTDPDLQLYFSTFPEDTDALMRGRLYLGQGGGTGC